MSLQTNRKASFYWNISERNKFTGLRKLLDEDLVLFIFRTSKNLTKYFIRKLLVFLTIFRAFCDFIEYIRKLVLHFEKILVPQSINLQKCNHREFIYPNSRENGIRVKGDLWLYQNFSEVYDLAAIFFRLKEDFLPHFENFGIFPLPLMWLMCKVDPLGEQAESAWIS